MRSISNFTIKYKTWIKLTLLALVAVALLFAVLASTRDVGTYVFDHGTTTADGHNLIKTVTHNPPAANGKPVADTVVYTFGPGMKDPILGLMYGTQSTLKIALGLLIVGFVGALAMQVKGYNDRYANNYFVNALVIIIAVGIAIGFASNLYVMIFAILAAIPAVLLLLAGIQTEMIEKKGAK